MAVRAIERASVALVLMDADEGFTDQDARVLSLVRDRGCAGALIVNKWDLAEAKEEGSRRRLRDEMERRLRGFSDLPQLRISAKTGKGVGRIFPLIALLEKSGSREIPTAELNRWLQDTVATHEPAMGQRGSRKRPLKFFYATQVGTRPPTFVLFCTEPDSVQGSYVRFLENRLRQRFDLEGAPVRLILRKRRSDAT